MEHLEKKRTLYTEEGYKVLVDELEYLKTTKMKQVKENLVIVGIILAAGVIFGLIGDLIFPASLFLGA